MILVVGCGFLGSYLLKHILNETNDTVIATVRSTEKIPRIDGARLIKCDISCEEDLKSLSEACKGEELKVFYFAACHNIDFLYENIEKGKEINITALKNFISYIPNIKEFYFASTDCVYGEGKSKDYRFKETDALNPINEYGKQKAEAEKIVIKNGFTVLRLPFMLGESLSSTPHFYDRITTSLKNNEEVEMIDGMYRSVLSYSQAAELIYSLSLLNEKPQVINLCSDESLSKYDMGCILAEKLGADKSLIKKISEDEGKKFFKDKRVAFGAMDNSLLKALLNKEKIMWEVEKC